jgi:hypothetical protein
MLPGCRNGSQELCSHNDGKNGVVFNEKCDFILQLKNGRAIAVEADRAVTATFGARDVKLAPYMPITIE